MPTLAFLLDVDNTLLDNDDAKKDYDEHLQAEIGPELTKRFWDIYEQVRHETSVVNIPLSLTRLREQTSLSEMDDFTYQHVRSIFDNYPFPKALYPHTLETLAYLRTLGLTIIASDGDLVFQAKKIFNSGLSDAVDGRVLIYDHKQKHLTEILTAYPAEHYVMVDDRPDILADSKAIRGDSLTTILVKQGKYSNQLPEHFVPDITVEHIGDLRNFRADQFYVVRK